MIPGWYEGVVHYENGDSMVSKITYYKNGQSKIEADYTTAQRGGIKIEAKVTMEGTWKVEDNALIETVQKVSAMPANLKGEIEKKMNIGNKLPSNTIIAANDEHLILQNRNGKQITYKRIKK
jgi:hypothetical protein